MKMSKSVLTINEISSWLSSKVAEYTSQPLSVIDGNQPFANYGFDSVQAISLTGDIDTWLGMELDPTVAWDYPTINQLSDYLHKKIQA